MEELAREFRQHGINSLFIYVREAHPGERYPCHETFDQKLSHARAMVDRWGIERTMLVDDLDGAVHTAYGSLPNMTYILGIGGTVIYRASWTDVRTVRMALEQIVYEREHRRNRSRITPYYVEWTPQRVNDRVEFLECLADDVGPRAVEEFIAAVESTTDESTSAPMWEWWREKQESQVPSGAD